MEKAAQVAFSASNLGEQIARLWIKAYERAPIAAIVGFGVATAVPVALVKLNGGAPLLKSPSYAEQLQTLDATRASLSQLSEFVEKQTGDLAERQAALAKVERERRRLEPLVNADRRTINAVLSEQQARADASASRERWIGFALGIIGAFVSQAVLFALGLALRRWSRSRTNEGE